MITNDTEGVLSMDGQDLTDKVIILNSDALSEHYQLPKYQFWKAKGGFGCSPFTSGRAVIATALIDGESCRWERLDFIGIASPELIKQFFPDQSSLVTPNIIQ